MPTGKEALFFTPSLRTDDMVYVSYELLDTTLEITRGIEKLLDDLAHIDPRLASSQAIVGLFKTTVSSKMQKRWDGKEAKLEYFLYLARVVKTSARTDLKLSEVLPTLDPNDPNGPENFLFSSRERMKFLLFKGDNRADSLKYGADAYTESRVLRMAIKKQVLLTQANDA